MPRSRAKPEPRGRSNDDVVPHLRKGEVLEFMRLLWAVDHGLQAASKQMASRLGVTGPQRLVIRIVGRFPGVLARDVAATLHMHKSTLVGVLDRLEARGVILREIDAADRRRARLYLSAQGRRLDRIRSGTVEAAVRRVLADRKRMGPVRDALVDLARALQPRRAAPAVERTAPR